MAKSNKYGYSGVNIPTQEFNDNKGKFDPNEINELVADNKWTQYGQLEHIKTQTATNSTTLTLTDIKSDIFVHPLRIPLSAHPNTSSNQHTTAFHFPLT